MRLSIIGWGILAIAGATSAGSGDAVPTESISSTGGDIEYGQYLSSECFACHQASGVDKGIPSITGWQEEAFVEVLKAYRQRDLPDRAMRNVAASLDDDQIKALAAFFATLPLPNRD